MFGFWNCYGFHGGGPMHHLHGILWAKVDTLAKSSGGAKPSKEDHHGNLRVT